MPTTLRALRKSLHLSAEKTVFVADPLASLRIIPGSRANRK
jgi:hypothetical protein